MSTRSSSLMLAVVCICMHTVKSSCDSANGPAGAYDCFQSRYYDYQGQWGTCVTNAYMRQKSKGMHACRDQTATYCYYQCMLEIHNIDQGNVTSDCTCDVTSPLTTQVPPSDVSTLPPSCYSPNGTECSWFSECLDAKFHCSGTEDDYGIAYGEAFCRLYYDNTYSSFSAQAKQWIDAVRRCLQVQLVPLLRPFGNPTCDDIKTKALTSHAGCYVTPYSGGANSICKLSFQDFWRVFWKLRTSFKTDFSDSVLKLMQVNEDCSRLPGGVVEIDSKMRILMLQLGISPPGRKMRSAHTLLQFLTSHIASDDELSASSIHSLSNTEFTMSRFHDRKSHFLVERSAAQASSSNQTSSTELRHHHMARDVGKELAQQLQWKNQGLVWFAYARYLGDNILEAYVMLADQSLASGDVNDTSDVNMTQAVTRAVEAFGSGLVALRVDGVIAGGAVLNVCHDLHCLTVVSNVTAPLISNGAPACIVTSSFASLMTLMLTVMVWASVKKRKER